MKKMFAAILVNLFLVSFSFAATGTADEAIALVDKAVSYIKAEGKEKAFVEFSKPFGQFVDKDLYILAIDYNGIVLAHGGMPKLIHRDISRLRDSDQVYFVKGFIALAKARGRGWVDYKFINPVTNKIEPKSTYIQKMDTFLLGCGIYK